jgi:hypothetical protein
MDGPSAKRIEGRFIDGAPEGICYRFIFFSTRIEPFQDIVIVHDPAPDPCSDPIPRG